MIYEYAVSPLLFSSLNDIAFIYSTFGVDQGRFISNYPRKAKITWIQVARHMIEKAAHDDIEKSRLIELLMTLDRRALYERQAERWDNQKNWVTNVIEENARREFRAIINDQPVDNHQVVSTIPETFSNSSWNNPQSISVPRIAKDIVNATFPLIQLSKMLVLIDRNFEPSEPRFVNVLVEFSKQLLLQGHQPKINQIKYVTTYETDKSNPRTLERFEHECQSYLPEKLPTNISVKFFIKPKALLHDRFVLTDRGCIQLGHGLDEGNEKVLITRLSHDDFIHQKDFWDKQSCREFVVNGTKK